MERLDDFVVSLLKDHSWICRNVEMSDKNRPGGASASQNPMPANDDTMVKPDPAVPAREAGKSRCSRFPRIFTDFPDRFPVLEAELDLIEAYLPELFRDIIANDNSDGGDR